MVLLRLTCCSLEGSCETIFCRATTRPIYAGTRRTPLLDVTLGWLSLVQSPPRIHFCFRPRFCGWRCIVCPRHNLLRGNPTDLEDQRVTHSMVDNGTPRRKAVRLSARELDTQRHLFGPDIKLVRPVSDAQMGRVLCDLRAACELESFRIWLVGSRVQPGRTGADIDVVLSPGFGTSPNDHLIEQALWHCREYGLYGATPACVIDPCFRAYGPTVDLVPLPPHATIETVKLLSPRLAQLAAGGRLRDWRRLGEFSIKFVRHAEDTDYYAKLPTRHFDGSLCCYLRPAIEIASADPEDLLHTIHANHSGPAGS